MTPQAIKPILLAKGVETESMALIEAGLSNGESPMTPGDKGLTALMIAATQGFYEGVERLLPLSDPLAVDLGGETALMCAAQATLNRNDPRRMGCIEALLPVSDALAANNTGGTALMRAAHFGSSSAIKILLPHSDAAAVDMNCRSALSLALASGASRVARRCWRRPRSTRSLILSHWRWRREPRRQKRPCKPCWARWSDGSPVEALRPAQTLFSARFLGLGFFWLGPSRPAWTGGR